MIRLISVLLAALCVLRALDADGLTRAFPRACIGASPLTANRKAAAMTNPAITVDRLKALEVALNLPAQITFDDDLVRGNRLE
jgi:hypothetical protein